MPSSVTRISKAYRMKTLLEVMGRWGKMNKEQIDVNVAQRLDLDPKSLRQALYRDLQELVAEGDITETVYAPDGSKIDHYDPDIHKNVRKEWSLHRHDHSVFGLALLQSIGGDIVVSPSFQREIRVDKLNSALPTGVFSICFHEARMALAVSFSKELLPFKVVLGRSSDQDQAVLNNEKWGRRLMFIALPNDLISKQHLSIEFQGDEEGAIHLSDLDSSNGSQVMKISHKEADEMVQQFIDNKSDLTLTSTWSNWGDHGPKKFREIESSQNPHLTQAPVCLALAENLILVVR